MSIKVNCIDEKKVKAELKNCPKEVQEYVKALEESNERWKYVNDEALKKIREQAKIISSNSVVSKSLPSNDIYTKDDVRDAYKCGKKNRTYYFNDGTLILAEYED